MTDVIVGENVINKMGEFGVIASVDDQYIYVSYKSRKGKLPLDAFEKKLLKYTDAKLQGEIDKVANQTLEEERLAADKAKKARETMEAQAPVGVKFNSVSIRFEPAPISLSSVKRKHKNTIQEIFNQCDKDIDTYYESFHPIMKYVTPRTSVPLYARPQHYGLHFSDHQYTRPTRADYYRSRYCVGFVTKYENSYVLRVLSRNDVYTIGMMGGYTVTNSDVTEILRIVCIDGETYYFSKHLSVASSTYKNTTLYKKWQSTQFANLVNLDEVIRTCDCRYLNDYIEQKYVNCFSYAKLLMAALFNNKAEIVFKNGLFGSTARIEDITSYLDEFTPRQIDFASKNNLINALPIIKNYANLDSEIYWNLEQIMSKQKDGVSLYDVLKGHLTRLDCDCSDLDKKLIAFLKKEEDFYLFLYRDYINEIAHRNDVTVDDFFDKNYEARLDLMLYEKSITYSDKTKNEYEQVAHELSWIDREEGGYFIIIPKTIPDFIWEGSTQHICVYTARYFYEVIDRKSIIVFLRKEIDKPYVTIEYDYETFEVAQARKKFNGRVEDELYQFIVDLGKQLKFEMDSQE